MAPLGGFSPTSRCSRTRVPLGRSTTAMPPPWPKVMANETGGLSPAIAAKCSLVRAVGQRAQRRDVIEDPERAAVRTGNQILVLDLEIVDRNDRQAARHALPGLAVVEREVDAGLGADEQ